MSPYIFCTSNKRTFKGLKHGVDMNGCQILKLKKKENKGYNMAIVEVRFRQFMFNDIYKAHISKGQIYFSYMFMAYISIFCFISESNIMKLMLVSRDYFFLLCWGEGGRNNKSCLNIIVATTSFNIISYHIISI